MTWKRGHALFAALSFFVPLYVYLRTITPTVPFWDSGEFIATSYITADAAEHFALPRDRTVLLGSHVDV